jgi:hypothetical protein
MDEASKSGAHDQAERADEPATREHPGAAPDDAAGDPAADEERARAAIDELRRLKVEDLALDMAISLVTVGYQKLGLTEQTRELRDLAGVRLSIELLRALLDVLEREGAAAKLGDLRGTLAAMQMNYARTVADEPAGGSEAAPEPDQEVESDEEAAPDEAPESDEEAAPEAPTA